MENQVSTDTEEKTPEQIEVEMMATRESLTEKVAALETQVMGTVHEAAHTLTETVDAVKSFVTTAPEAVGEKVEEVASAVKERVKRTFDISAHVQDNPWTCMGLAVGAGFLAGWLLSNGRTSSSSLSSARRSEASATPMYPQPFATAPPTAGFLDHILSISSRKIKDLTEAAIDATAAALNNVIREKVPHLIDDASKWVAQDTEYKTERFDEGRTSYR